MGTVKAIGVGAYWDESCTSRVTEIDWGFIEPGGLMNITIFLRNEGNAPFLSINTENWNPINTSDHITLQLGLRQSDGRSRNSHENKLDISSIFQSNGDNKFQLCHHHNWNQIKV